MSDLKEYIDTIVKNDYTYGTGACAVVNKKVKMELNEFGEYRPNIKIVSEIEEQQENKISMLSVSPNSKTSPNEDEISRKLYAEIPGIKYDKRIGYYKELYAGHVVEGNYRKNASSGGFGTWIFKELLERKLIDGVIHVKENKDKEDSVLFKYDISRTIEEIQEGAKTKYYPVEFSQVINKLKEVPGRYAIIGIPSFIMAIRLLSEQDPIIKERIKFTVGLICGHQKSAKFAECLAWQVGIKPGDLKFIDFRKKVPNEPSNSYGVELTGTVNGKEITIVKKMGELLGHNWGQGFFKSNASDFTDDVMNETADVTLGDAWLPEYTSDSEGNNVILVRNELIANILEEGIRTKKVKLDNISAETIVKSQASHFQHTREELGYRLYKKDQMGQWRPEKRIPASNNIPFLRKMIQDLRMEISKQSHLSFKKAVELGDLNYFINHMERYIKRYNRLYYIKSIVELGPKNIIVKISNKIIRKIRKVRTN
ncbi:Coenzyme F420 hydrogenase/dehydrogenase, beta subunit C-terminal domain [Bacillus sp. AFS040349]|uniref:Coenzyme F420 hydrogenase/dehydrogenase, beta subunit C-terminal domain n=1 Tax=Bacillus sp. AFS040349 TaxID=2033502 RepID=UPI000BFC137C|nr:Coenzyme F420 hydrogenase/dehydrogenase, beta subunit C-terminal domain [Bacillus sp. AFS040349]PGT89043.1 coenzyme F420 hydrogenase [Bacillus sp. AFS040349]